MPALQLTRDLEEELVPNSMDHAAFLQQTLGHDVVDVNGDHGMVVDDQGRTIVWQMLQPIQLKA